MALNTLLIYLSFCFVIVASEEMTQWYRGWGDQGGISEMSGPDKDSGIPKQRERYELKIKHEEEQSNEKVTETCRSTCSG